MGVFMNCFVSKIFLLSLTFVALPFARIWANPAPLGIELLKSTKEDVSKKYKVIDEFESLTEEFTNVYFYTQELDISTIKMEGLKQVRVFTDKDGLVHGVSLQMNEIKFDEILKSLRGKYTETFSNLQHIGDKEVFFKDGDCVIGLFSMGFDMELIYASTYLKKISIEGAKEEERRKSAAIDEML